MPRLTRRTFVGWIGAVAAIVGVRRRAAAEDLSDILPPRSSEPAAVLDAELLLALAHAVLPQELGREGVATTARGFSAWLRGYKGGAELLHGYGTGELTFAPESPTVRWQKQLGALDADARALGAKGFVAATVEHRQRVVRTALAGEKLTAFPAPQAAAHIALGLMAWYYQSPDATDQCYRVAVGKNQCRPLALNPSEPVGLRKGGAAPRGLMPKGGA